MNVLDSAVFENEEPSISNIELIRIKTKIAENDLKTVPIPLKRYSITYSKKSFSLSPFSSKFEKSPSKTPSGKKSITSCGNEFLKSSSSVSIEEIISFSTLSPKDGREKQKTKRKTNKNKSIFFISFN